MMALTVLGGLNEAGCILHRVAGGVWLHTLKFPVYVAITDSGELGDPRFQVTFSFEDKLGWKRGELDRLLGMLKES